jgi:hypothetical protein
MCDRAPNLHLFRQTSGRPGEDPGLAGQPEAKVLAGNQALDYNHLGVKPTQD